MKRSHQKSGKKLSARLLTVCQFLLLAVLVISSAVIFRTKHQAKAEEDAFAALAEAVKAQQSAPNTGAKKPAAQSGTKPASDAESSSKADPSSAAASDPAQDTQYTEYYLLYEMNSDFVGWLSIPETGLDYPVMSTPTDPEYYLRRDFNGAESKSGTPFLGEGASLDSDLCIIYGHNMKNDTMFGTLDEYLEQSYYEAHPRFVLTTLTERREYEIFAAKFARVLYVGEAGYRYYDHAGDLTAEEYAELVSFLKKSVAYDTEITPEYGEQIILLSTCSYHEENGRILVAARRIS